MPDFSGPIQALELARWLWLIPFFPLLGALVNALYASGLLGAGLQALQAAFADDDAPRAKSPPRKVAAAWTSARVAASSLALSAVSAGVYCSVLADRAAGERFLLRHLWQIVRVGQLDVGMDLAFDPLAATLVLVVTLVATALALYTARSGELKSDEVAWRFFGWLGAVVFFLVLVLMADNLLLLLLAWEGAGLAGFALVRCTQMQPPQEAATAGAPRGMGAFLTQRAGDGAILAGAALLFWALGGTWTSHDDYQSDLEPRISAVSITPDDTPLNADAPSLHGGAATVGHGFLTVAALPGALVYVDDSRTPLLDFAGLPLRTPFVHHEVSGGVHAFRVAPDDGFRLVDRGPKSGSAPYALEGGVLPNYNVTRFAVGGDRDAALMIVGPTLRFREMRDQLAVVDAKGAHRLKDALVTRGVLGGNHGLGVASLACLLVFLGACAKSIPLPLRTVTPVSVSSLVQASGMAIAGTYLLARLAFLFSLSQTASLVVTVVGLAAALFGGMACMVQYDLRRLIAYSSISQLGLAFVAVGAHAYWVAVLQVTTHAIVKTLLLVSAGSLAHGMRSLEKDPVAAQDLRKMGGLSAAMPRTRFMYSLACLGLTAVPVPLLAGFWPLAGILEHTFGTGALPEVVARVVYALVVATAAVTSFGMWRGYYLAFAGKARSTKAAAKVADSLREGLQGRIAGLLAALVACSGLVLGASSRDVGGEGQALLEGWLSPVLSASAKDIGAAHLSVVARAGIVGLALAVAYGAWALARHRYGDGRPSDWAEREARMPGQALGASTR